MEVFSEASSSSVEPSHLAEVARETVFFAHSTERNDKSDWKSFHEHLTSVGELAASYAAWFGARPLAHLAGMLHDLGKYTREFQLRLSGDYGRMDHATWGARIACERYG